MKSIFNPEFIIIYFIMERRRAANYIIERLKYIIFEDAINENIKNEVIKLYNSSRLTDWQSLKYVFNCKEHKERIMNIWTGLEKLDISSDRIIKLALLKTMLNTKLNQEKDMKKLLLETFELNESGRVDDDFLHQVIHESLKIISDIEKIKNNINQLESIAIYKNNLFIKKIKNTKRRVIQR